MTTRNSLSAMTLALAALVACGGEGTTARAPGSGGSTNSPSDAATQDSITPSVPDGGDAGGGSVTCGEDASCLVTVLVADTPNPGALHTDGTSVYFRAEVAAVMRVSPNGGPVTELARTAAIQGFAVDGVNVYYSDPTGLAIMQVPVGGGSSTKTVATSGAPAGVAINANGVYWTSYYGGLVASFPRGATTEQILVESASFAGPLVVDSSHAYWVSKVSPGETGGVFKVALAGGDPVALAPNEISPNDIAVDDTNVYWVNDGATSDGALRKLPIDGGTPVTLASGLAHPASLAVGGGFIYWVNAGDAGASQGTVMRIATSGGTPVVLATGIDFPRSIALDDRNVYFTSTTAMGSVLKMPR